MDASGNDGPAGGGCGRVAPSYQDLVRRKIVEALHAGEAEHHFRCYKNFT